MLNNNGIEKFDGSIESIDWRSSAAIVGLIEYLNYFDCEYDSESNPDVLYYHIDDIDEDNYFSFVESKYPYDMHHFILENLLKQDDFTEEDIKEINEKLKANTIMKKIFSKLKFNGENKEEILSVISKNRLVLTKETYRNKLNLYRNFANENLLFSKPIPYARLVGYYVDGPKKGKSVGYNFNKNTYFASDLQEYDFIPFAFTIGRESLFINDNSSIQDLVATNNQLKSLVKRIIEEEKFPDVRKVFFQAMVLSGEYIDFDVEVIVKNQNKDYFETLFLRKKSIEIFNKLTDFKCFCFFFKYDKINDYINIQKEVSDAIVNLTTLDYLIEIFLKEDHQRYEYLIQRLIEVNVRVRGGERMFSEIKQAKECAKKIVQTKKLLNPQKVKSYRTKLSSALVFKDYIRYCDILIQLANYAEVELDFAYKLFDNFEENKEIAYAFVNALGTGLNNKEDGKNE
ncbi:type I CRISPR-associated protein Cas8a1/Csx8 [Anaerovorax sp. IOR16]|uniref:type I CRISPR-associated protein Cas8a1/Csx8 n=1 Tax=Anaerovorax sp. IOR16 TaxID=2773458 RepID=UPI0019CFAFC4|nr:type I CRISPR-associated protein Cas8a1/Csx8 [Anaerovorax sp. IOR16]